MTFRSFVPAALCLSVLIACASIDPFTRSDQAMMAQVADEVAFGPELNAFFAEAAGKEVVIVNLESDQYTDDQLPEYMLLDAFYTRLTSSDIDVVLLDRDPDVLALMEREREGIDLPATWSYEPAMNPDSLTHEQRRHELGELIADLVDDLSGQDVLVLHDAPCCGERDERGGVLKEQVIANEVGPEKAALLRELVEQYMSLYPEVETVERPTRHVDLTTADYLVAYRVYEFGTWKNQVSRNRVERISYLKLHVRVIDLATGAIVVSDFMEHRISDTLTSGEASTLKTFRVGQEDFGRPSSRTPDDGSRGGSLSAQPPSYEDDAGEEKRVGPLRRLLRKIFGGS